MRTISTGAAVRPRLVTDRDTQAERQRLAAGRAALERAASYDGHVLRTLEDLEATLEQDRHWIEAHPDVSGRFLEVAGVKRRALEAARHALTLYLRRDPAA